MNAPMSATWWKVLARVVGVDELGGLVVAKGVQMEA